MAGAHDPLSSDLERSLRLSDGSVESEEVTETVGRPEVLVLPKRIPCEVSSIKENAIPTSAFFLFHLKEKCTKINLKVLLGGGFRL